MYTAGIDLGGTRVRVGVIDEHYKLLHWEEAASEVAKGHEYTLGIIFDMLNRAREKYQFSRIGICAPGPLDHKKGILLNPPNLINWINVPVTSLVENQFKLPVYLLNDANAAALSEASSGSGADYESVWFTTVSTGVGSGYVHDGRLIQGAFGCAGEIGNMIIKPDGLVHSNLNPGALEAYASGTALSQVSKEQFGWQGGAQEAIERAMHGEKEALHLINETMTYLAIGLANVVHTVNPDVFVMGGGVMTNHAFLLPILEAKTNERVYESLRGTFDFKYAMHGKESGVLGAGVYARSQILDDL
ncbi:ROK family protein [Jeotgalibacillus proteolyticus]|uniref:ROK family protein n=1 Tax=Jeotgalibacillus proteolyticus TaxID=2082395 RepID=A0A2S5GC18_9BACL|nr:ROK family protein [Jeotgalibacillus proteolyticus]PPA70461.1 ROK family protein [Jeotgalibacillus proteolyticus]